MDGNNGNTLLHPLIGQFLHTTLVCNGGVVKAAKGEGREIVLDVTTDHARLEDLLQLAVKADQPVMTGQVKLSTRFDLPPGNGDILDRLRLDGTFGVGSAEFANATIRQKLEGRSRRGQSRPEDEDEGSAVSDLKGSFRLQDGQTTSHNLTVGVTGATVELAGFYGLRDEKLDFHSRLRLQAKLSQAGNRIHIVPVEAVRRVFPEKWGDGSSDQGDRNPRTALFRVGLAFQEGRGKTRARRLGLRFPWVQGRAKKTGPKKRRSLSRNVGFHMSLFRLVLLTVLFLQSSILTHPVDPLLVSSAKQTDTRKTSTPYTGDLSIFDSPGREERLQIDRVMTILGVEPGKSVADIGAGSGWFTVRAAKQVGTSGKVYAVDINPEAIHYIEDRVRKEQLHNVTTILGRSDDPLLPARQVDAVLLLKTYHEVAKPVALLRNVRASLRPGAKLGIIDRNGNGENHGVDRSVVLREASEAGYELDGSYDFVKDGMDYFLVFGVKP